MGSKKSPPPDPAQQALAYAQVRAMDDQLAMSKEEFEFMKTYATEQAAKGDEQWAYNKELQDAARARSDRYDQRYWDTTAKQEDAFYKHVDNFDTAQERTRLGSRAIADVEGQVEIGRGAMSRGLAARGINAGSAAAISAYGDMEFGGALAKAGAATMAEEAARREGMQLRAQAAGLGGNTSGAAASYLGAAGNFGDAALDASGTGLRARAGAFGAYNGGAGVAQGWGAGANSSFNSTWQQQNAHDTSGGLDWGGMLGTVVGSAAGGYGYGLGKKWGGT